MIQQPLKVIQDAIPCELAYQVKTEFETADYDKIVQERKGQFAREFPEPVTNIPGTDEVYYSEFYRSRYLENSPIILETFNSHLKPIIETATGKVVVDADLRCYKMTEGGHFRIHRDSNRSDIGFILYLSENWKWDWGGLLLVVQDDSTATVTIPKFNQLVIMDHKYSQIPHCVTPVTQFAKEPRFIIVGFLRSED
jgi:Rps23 Pro-64 3,4-dihydroxylase Tpa1-like proline 4-hydroxylase